MNTYDKINMIAPNVSKVFYYSFQGNNTFVRTGTIGDGSCLFHSLLYAYSTEKYKNMDDSQKSQLVKRLRENLSSKINKDTWRSLNKGIISMISVQEFINQIFSDLYEYSNHINNESSTSNVKYKSIVTNIYNKLNRDEKSKRIFSFLLQAIKIDDILSGDGIVEIASRDCSDLIKYRKNIVKAAEDKIHKILHEKLNKDKYEYFRSLFIRMVKLVFDYSENAAYKSYKVSLENNEMYIDHTHTDLISDKFDLDIYFIDSNTRLPYLSGFDKSTYKKRKSVIVLWINNSHYEIIGKVYDNNKVQRLFEPDDPIIELLYDFYCNQKKFCKENPQYINLLPKHMKNKILEESRDALSDIESVDESDNDSVRSDKFYSSDNE